MNDLVRFATSVELATGKKRGRHPVFSSRQFYPYAAERRLQNALRNELEDYIGAAYGAAVFGESFKSDSLEELALLPEGLSDDFKAEISYAAESIARKVSSSVAEMTEMTVGKPYYPQAAKESLLKDWEANFQMLCVSAESDAKKDIARLVTQAKNEGWNGKQLEKAVMKELPDKYANRASLIARTESAKLNTAVTLSTYKEIGCHYYMWMATLDERVRPDHAVMNGLICSATDPTVWYEENPDDPMHPIEHKRDDTMVHLHPGEDFQCRCTMVMWDPVIDGKYEVKEGEKPEEEPEEEPESDPASRELEKANERLAEKEKELEKAENERKTVEKELAQEKSARKVAEKALKETEESRFLAEKKAENALSEKKSAENFAEKAEMSRQAAVVANKFGFRLQEEIETPEISLNKANPNYGKKGYDEDCQRSAVTYIARTRGLDVEALPSVENDSLMLSPLSGERGYMSGFVGGKTEELIFGTKTKLKEAVVRIVKEAGDGAQYLMYVAWVNESYGHIFVIENRKGRVLFKDPQTKEKNCEFYFDYIRVKTRGQYPELTRVDDLPFSKECNLFFK